MLGCLLAEFSEAMPMRSKNNRSIAGVALLLLAGAACSVQDLQFVPDSELEMASNGDAGDGPRSGGGTSKAGTGSKAGNGRAGTRPSGGTARGGSDAGGRRGVGTAAGPRAGPGA